MMGKFIIIILVSLLIIGFVGDYVTNFFVSITSGTNVILDLLDTILSIISDFANQFMSLNYIILILGVYLFVWLVCYIIDTLKGV